MPYSEEEISPTTPLTIYWYQQYYSERTRSLYSLCKAWFEGYLPLEEFYDDEAQILGVPHHIQVECHCDSSIADTIKARELTDEFNYVAAMARAIMWANAELVDDGFQSDVAPIVRAMYFAREWGELSEGFDGRMPVLVYSR
jgi:hypothetical protein